MIDYKIRIWINAAVPRLKDTLAKEYLSNKDKIIWQRAL